MGDVKKTHSWEALAGKGRRGTEGHTTVQWDPES